jgi:hypothetical protein
VELDPGEGMDAAAFLLAALGLVPVSVVVTAGLPGANVQSRPA